MSKEIDALFGNFRPTAFTQDPNAVPQQVAGGSGNIAPTGWLQDGSVTADVISANAVTAGKIDAGAVTATEIAAGSITTSKIAAGAVTANEIAANTITAAKIAADTITANEIAASAITATELATDSVTTNKILAANVTTAKIELTLSGHKYGATAGTTSAPGVFFDAANTVGLTLDAGATDLVLGSGSGVTKPYLQVGPGAGGILFGNQNSTDLYPGIDNTAELGLSAARWVDVWAVDGTINTSDERLKKDIADTPLGLDFVKSLRPRVYRWRDTKDTQASQAVQHDKDALAAAVKPHIKAIEAIRAKQMAGKIDDDEANRLIQLRRTRLERVQNKFLAPVIEARGKRREGKRLHHGLIAQEVKAALDSCGVDAMDAAFWKVTEDGTQSLAYTELIAPLLRAVQELAAKVERLEAGTSKDQPEGAS